MIPPESESLVHMSVASTLNSQRDCAAKTERSLPKRLRFKSRGQFQRAQQIGKRCHTQHLIAYLVLNADKQTRFGVTVSKKVGKAHQRSYLKRLIREAFRHSVLRQSSGFDVSLIAKKDMTYPKLSQLITELNSLALGAAKLKSGFRPKQSRSGKTHKRHRSKQRAHAKNKQQNQKDTTNATNTVNTVNTVSTVNTVKSAQKKSTSRTQNSEREGMSSSSSDFRGRR